MKKLVFCIALTLTSIVQAQNTVLKTKIAQKAVALENQVIQWRRDFHQNPELGNSEFKTAEKIATYLKSIGIQVQTGVAKTGVVGILKGGKSESSICFQSRRRIQQSKSSCYACLWS